MTGYMKTELIGADVSMFWFRPRGPHRRVRSTADRSDRRCSMTAGTYEDVEIVRKDGYIRFVDLSVRLVSSDRHASASRSFRDVTEKKRMERELITKHTELREAYFAAREARTPSFKRCRRPWCSPARWPLWESLPPASRTSSTSLCRGSAATRRSSRQSRRNRPRRAALALREIVSSVDKMAGDHRAPAGVHPQVQRRSTR